MKLVCIHYTCPPVLAFRFRDFRGWEGRLEDALPRVGGVKPKVEQCWVRSSQCWCPTIRLTLLKADSSSKSKGPTRQAEHSIYLLGLGV